MRAFDQLFAGRADCYGIYRINEITSSGKQKGRGTTYPNRINPDAKLKKEQWDNHLFGKEMLGIVPVLPGGFCNWFGIDIDDYSVDHEKLIRKIEVNELPLIICRSKSGGAHAYCFFSETVKSLNAINAAKVWASKIGYPNAEIFPKQADPGEKGIGNWINLPYFGGDKTERYAFGLNSERLSLNEFVQFANAKSISQTELIQLLKSSGGETEEEILNQSPPCIVKMINEGIPSDRNTCLFHFGVYFKKRGDDDWIDKLGEANEKYCKKPLSQSELHDIINNHKKRDYQYKCKDGPMPGLCDKNECLKRKFGVGLDYSHYEQIEIDRILKIDSRPPVWIVTVNGSDMSMDTVTLLSPRKFREKILEELNFVAPNLTQYSHDKMVITPMKQSLTIEEAPLEISLDGQIVSTFKEWTGIMCPLIASKDDLSKGMPYYDEKNDQIFFRGEDFQRKFRQTHRRDIAARTLWAALRNLGCENKTTRVKGKPVKVWVYPIMGQELWFDMEIKDDF